MSDQLMKLSKKPKIQGPKSKVQSPKSFFPADSGVFMYFIMSKSFEKSGER